MKYRILALSPFLLGAALVAYGLTAPDPTTVYFYVHRAMPVLACLGMFSAASRFSPRDQMCWAWAMQGLSYGLLVTSALVFGSSTRTSIHQLSHFAEVMRSALSILVNLVGVLGMSLFARAFATAGLALAGEAWKRWAVYAGAAGFAVAVAGPAALGDLRHILAGDPHGIVGLASDLGDGISFTLVGPVLLTAVSLRGGLLAWPWTLLTLSMIGWLGYDTASPLCSLLHVSDAHTHLIEESILALANGLSCTAGIAQLWVASHRHGVAGGARVATRAG